MKLVTLDLKFLYGKEIESKRYRFKFCVNKTRIFSEVLSEF